MPQKSALRCLAYSAGEEMESVLVRTAPTAVMVTQKRKNGVAFLKRVELYEEEEEEKGVEWE